MIIYIYIYIYMGNNWYDNVDAVEFRWMLKYGFCCDTNDDDVICFVIVVWCYYDWLW